MPPPPVSSATFRVCWPPSARSPRTSTPPCATSSRSVRREGDAALVELSAKFDRADLAATGISVGAEEIAAALAVGRRADARCAEARARPHRRPSRAADAEGRPLYRRARRRARLALDGDRGRRPLRAGRHGGLSELGADERRAGRGRRRRAHRHGGAGARAGSSTRWCWPPPHLAGVSEIYRVGGAQAIAALAYGTRDDRARSPRSSAPATPMWRRPSGRSSARSAST